MIDSELFEPYDKLITVYVNGESRHVPENNTILRCLQYLAAEAISYGDLCWNGDCLNCEVRVSSDGSTRKAFACLIKAVDGMSIETVNPAIDISIGQGD